MSIQPTEHEIVRAKIDRSAARIRRDLLALISLMEKETDKKSSRLFNEILNEKCGELEDLRKKLNALEDLFAKDERGRLSPEEALIMRKLIRPLFRREENDIA
jgi:bacterioferritin (cytochrome b1)